MMGLAPSELENLTPYEFMLMLEGYKQREVQAERRARNIFWMTYACTPKGDNDETLPPHALYPLPGDPKWVPKEERKQAREVDPGWKARMEAMMNSIPNE